MPGRPFAILDRDGTIIFDRHYLARAEQVELLPGAAEGLRRLRRLGLGLLVVSNQTGVARGYFDEAAVEAANERLRQLLRAEEVELDGVEYCPHHPEAGCPCRKPATGLVDRVAGRLEIDLPASFVIGDKPSDVQLGRNLGAVAVLVRTGREPGGPDDPAPDLAAADLAEAARRIEELVRARAQR